jgi:hypothetical protein
MCRLNFHCLRPLTDAKLGNIARPNISNGHASSYHLRTFDDDDDSAVASETMSEDSVPTDQAPAYIAQDSKAPQSPGMCVYLMRFVYVNALANPLSS